jgi:catechol 2,3-dioxygenase-like lactoylglutathione lyase family enzyme
MAPRDIDHLVLAVRDLNAARAIYTRLGFTLTPVAHHPFGTVNSLAQMNGSFLELLAVADPTAISEPSATRFSFGAFNREYLAEREGLSMIALQSRNAAADRADFEERGLPVYDPFRFERVAKGPDRTDRMVAFSLTATSDARVHGQAGFFTCQQHFPENFWRSEFQRHVNGGMHVASAVFVTRDPADFHEFLTHFTGQHDMLSTSLHVRFDIGQGSIDVLSPVAFEAYFGEDAGPDPRRFTGCRIAVSEIAATRALFTANDVPFQELSGALVVPSTFAHGVAIAFVADAPRGARF